MRHNCRPELESGALVQLLSDWEMEPIELHAARLASPVFRQAD
jgi:hypothetical protein